MWTFSFPPTRRRTVAANLVWVFSTCGGCFSMMKVLGREKGEKGGRHGLGPKLQEGTLSPTVCDSLLETSTWMMMMIGGKR